MTRALRFALPAAILGLLVLWPALARTQGGRPQRERFNGRDVVAGEVLVRLTDQAAARLADVRRLVDATEDQPVGSGGWRRLRSDTRGVQALLQLLRARGDVLDVEPNYILTGVDVPNDPAFGFMWGLHNPYTAGADIHATSAWEVTHGSSSIVVGVVDTGVDFTHPDLAANMWSAPSSFNVTIGGRRVTCPAGSHGFNALAYRSWANAGYPSSGSLADAVCVPADDGSHGTHVAGTIGAVGGNGVGVTGVSWTTRLMALKFLDAAANGNTADAINAIDFAIQTKAAFSSTNGANVRVLSNSYGGGDAGVALSSAISRAASAEILFVAAAGNANSDNDIVPFYPASYTNANVLSVAATDAADVRAGFSNYGANSVDLGAPGSYIYSTLPGGGYDYMSGTSMATPHVAGAAALVLAACSQTTSQLKATLLSTVDAVPSLSGITVTGGRLNVDRAIRSCATLPSVTLTSPTAGASYTAPASISLEAMAADADGIGKVEFYAGSTLIGTAFSSPYGGTWSDVPAGVYSLTARAYDVFGASTVSAAVPVTVTSGGGGTPAWTSADVGVVGVAGSTTESGGTFTVRGAGADIWDTADGFHYAYQALTGDGQIVARVASFNAAISWAKAGVMLRDGLGASARHVSLLMTPGNGVAFERRTAVGGGTDYVGAAGSAPSWLKLERSGATVQAFTSSEGSTWTLVATTTLALPETVYIGLAVTSHTTGALATAVFDQVTTPNGNPSTNIPPTVAVTQPVAGASAVAPATWTLEATAADSNGIQRVEFYAGTTLIGTATASPYQSTWSNVPVGVYSLTAKAYDMLGASAVSAAVPVTVTSGGGTPAWTSADVGAVGVAGSTTESGGTFTVRGAGADIWDTADGFHYAYQALTGDGQIVARVVSFNAAISWAKAGVMLRDGLGASARHVSLLMTPGNGVAFERRTATGGGTDYVGAAGSIPSWLKLERSGATVQAFTSSEGSTWTLVATTTLALPETVYIGLAVTSHATGALATAVFDQVTTPNGNPPTNIPPTVAVTQPVAGASAVAPATWTLEATAADSDGIQRVEFYAGTTLIGTATASPYQSTWSNVPVGVYSLTAKAYDGLGASAVSAAVPVTVTSGGGTPAWTSVDVGAVGVGGSTTESGGTFTVRGAGADIWDTADGFHYAYQALTGDGQIVARVVSFNAAISWAKAGVMLRDGLGASARHVSLLMTPGNGVAFERRTATGGGTDYVGAAGSIPSWLKLERSGATVQAFTSSEGSTWTLVATTTLALPETVYIGLAVTSHDAATLATAAFDNVTW